MVVVAVCLPFRLYCLAKGSPVLTKEVIAKDPCQQVIKMEVELH
jgi:hypothetical protein